MALITANIELALSDLHQGRPVAIPTETVYGLAAPIHNEQAVRAVFAMKNRPLNHPLIVHVAAGWDLSELVDEVPDYAYQLMEQFWPGPLTLVLKRKQERVNPLITGGQNTVAIRCPAHPLAQELLNKLHIPLVAPSANPFGKVSPTTALHVQESFPNVELTILDGGRCTVGIESTIIDASNPEYYQILRHGLLEEHTLAMVIHVPIFNAESRIRVPGKLDSHYQPQKTLYYFEDSKKLHDFCEKNRNNVSVIAAQCPATVDPMHYHSLGHHPESAAYELYFQLRKADASNTQCIAIELPPESGLWQGLRERILKAGIPYSQ